MTDDPIALLAQKFSTPARAVGDVPDMDLREAVRKLAKIVLDQCNGRPKIGSAELDALQYAAVAVSMSETPAIDPSKFVVLTIEEAEKLARDAE